MGGRSIPMEDRMRQTTPRSIEDGAARLSARPGVKHPSIVGALCLIAEAVGLCAQKIHELKPQNGTGGRQRPSKHTRS